LEATRFMKSKISEVVEEDESCDMYSLQDITAFCSGDFELENGRHGRTITKGKGYALFTKVTEWVAISVENEDKIDKEEDNKIIENQISDNLKELEIECKNKTGINFKSKIKTNNRLMKIPSLKDCDDSKSLYRPSRNLIIKNKIIRLLRPLNSFRSNLGIEVEIQFLMAGESSLYIFSRRDSFTPEVAVCYIEKELDSSRKFISFALIENKKENSIIKTHKKQEIPKTGNIKI
jgi:hypothetical protein